MIEVNLLPGKKKKKAGVGLTLPDFSALTEKFKDPLMMGAVGSWVVVLPIVGYLFVADRSTLGRLEAEVAQVESQARRFQNVIRQKRRQEALHDSLEAELVAIREIDADRYVWPHALEEITKALPDFTWLVSVEFVPAPSPGAVDDEAVGLARPLVRFIISGRTSEIGAYTRFLRNLGSSPWITGVDPGPTSTVMEEERPITAFSVTGTFVQADSGFIRTVPVRGSVR